MKKKQINIICQSKGGSGKSFAIWSFANIYQADEKVIFIDLDDSTKTSSRLSTLVGERRVSHFSVLDEHKKIERESFLNMLEMFSKANFEKMFIDFGAAESEEFLKFIQIDFSSEVFKETCDELNLEIKFYIVLAGNDTLNACLNYTMQLTSLLENQFSIVWFFNLGLSGGLAVRTIAKEKVEAILIENHPKARFITYGDLGFSQSALDIIQMLTHNRSLAELSLAAKLKFKQVIQEFKDKIYEN